MKKFLAILLAAAMILSLTAVVSFADGGFAHADKENIALGKYVDAWDEGGANASLEMPRWFSKDNLVDGYLDEFDNDGTNLDQSLSWYGVSLQRDTDIIVTVDLDGVYTVDEIFVFPTKFLIGAATPSTFTIDISLDGDTWTNVGGEVDLPYGQYTDSFFYEADGAEASFVRIRVTKASELHDNAGYYSGFGELEVYGSEVSSGPVHVPEMRDFDSEKGDGLSFDKIYIDGVEVADGNAAVIAQKAGIDGTDGSISQITLYGWYGNKTSPTVAFGYKINDEDIVYGDFFMDTEPAVTQLAANNRRFFMPIDVSALTGENVIWVYAKLANGDEVKLNRYDNRGQENGKDREIYVIFNGPAGEEVIIGDADGDGELSDWDAITFERYLAGWNVEINLAALDVDADGEVSDWDAIVLSRYLAGWDVQLGA